MAAPTQTWNILRDSPMVTGASGAPNRYRRIRQLYVALPANGAVSLAHGLLNENGQAATPLEANLDPASNNNFYLVPQANNLAWDSTNIYIFVGNISGGNHQVYVTITF